MWISHSLAMKLLPVSFCQPLLQALAAYFCVRFGACVHMLVHGEDHAIAGQVPFGKRPIREGDRACINRGQLPLTVHGFV